MTQKREPTLAETFVQLGNFACFLAGFFAASFFWLLMALVAGGATYYAGFEDGETAMFKAFEAHGATPLEDPTR